MDVIEVLPGVAWVEVPEADLRVLCGAPADVVKHLMKRGLIRSVERNGVRAETGPNAILLSDLSSQAGELCNLGEFPVLQMLYRQGMILPGHPNNTGRRPLLIGRRDQLRAQMDYIHRGNYGLTSVEEMVAAGVPADTAAEWMRIKLRFAFGAIRRPEDLLDQRELEEGTTELAPGVTVRRIDVNVFEFRHGEETATVDLNLQVGTPYEAPYRLGYRHLRREYFSVVHSGEGDGWDVNRPTMGSILMFQGRIYLIDAGPNLGCVLEALGIGVHEIDGIFQTHCHDDHFAGLTTLVRSDHRVRYFATPAVRATVARKLSALMGIPEAEFGDFFDVHDLAWDVWNGIDGLEVLPLFSPHPVETSIFQFRTLWENGTVTYAHYADIASLRVLIGMVTDDPAEPGITAALAEKVRQAYQEPATLKKVDIGGGLIHGEAQDFAGDLSDRLILAHTARALNWAEKEIGSGAPFGTVDVLIPACQDTTTARARDYLRSAFPQVPDCDLNILLNHPPHIINPDSLLIREGQVSEVVHLVLTGTVEVLNAGAAKGATLGAGALIGQLAALTGVPAGETVRAVSFVTALRVPAVLFRAFVARNGLREEIERAADVRGLLNRTWMFGENLSAVVENRIVLAAREVAVAAGEEVRTDGEDAVFIVRAGLVQMRLDGGPVEDVGPAEVFTGSRVMVGATPPFRHVAAEDTLLLAVPGDLVRAIPVVRWKLLEMSGRRMNRLFAPREDGPAFPWLPDYALGVPDMDRQHRQLFEMASVVLAHQQAGEPAAALDALDALIDFARRHFAEEERELFAAGFPGAAEHEAEHAHLMIDVDRARDQFRARGHVAPEPFRRFFRDWIVQHIFREDSRYAAFFTDQRSCVSPASYGS
ncbi:bacteriohemerythrin [Novispirillum sp. DQ9]|uniref:bacteriohemerythrin n=1 Tax=Novispirillum sp. DQ9 TaxID=3398612 RepID=UPI003C7E4FF1